MRLLNNIVIDIVIYLYKAISISLYIYIISII